MGLRRADKMCVCGIGGKTIEWQKNEEKLMNASYEQQQQNIEFVMASSFIIPLENNNVKECAHWRNQPTFQHDVQIWATPNPYRLSTGFSTPIRIN